MQTNTKGAVLALAGLLATAAPAGAVGLDPSFGTAGKAFTPLSATLADRYYAATPAPAGGTYSAGVVNVDANDRAFVVSRVDAAGKLDRSFGTGGSTTVNVSSAPFGAVPDAPSGAAQASPTGGGEIAQGVATQPDGKVVVVGQAETPGGAGKPDGRDTDIYVVRLTASGGLDASFGTNGIKRIDLTNGITAVTNGAATTTSVTGDQGYGVSVDGSGRIVLTGGRGVDSATNAAVPDRDFVAIRLTASGALDGSFGTGGIASVRTPGISENARNGRILPDGRIFGASYGNVPKTLPATGTQQQPVLFRFTANGQPDPTFRGGSLGADGLGKDGVATASIGARAEAYGVALNGADYVVAGYGARTGSTNTDLVAFRFKADGTWDQGFGTDGIVSYAGAAGGADRARNLTELPDGRIVMVGHTENPITPAPADSNGLIFVIKPDGTPDAGVGTGGAVEVDLGGPSDFLYGVSVDGLRITAAGFLGASAATGDDAALARLDLTPPKQDGPVVTQPTAQAPAPTVPVAPAPAAPKPLSKSAGKVTLSCVRTGKQKDRIRCTVTQSSRAAGTVKLTLKRKGTKTLSGSAKTTKGKGRAVVSIKAKRGKAKYTVTLTLPTPAGVTQKLTRTVTVR